MDSVLIRGRRIGAGLPPYVVAEMSGNHNQSFAQALAIVDAAKRAGASALKLQTYRADTLTIDSSRPDFLISDADSLWRGKRLYELYETAYTKWDWVAEIMRYCERIGLACFSSVFDASSVDFLEDLNACAYKIASFENIHLPLLRKAASTRKPLLVSTGMASELEIDEAVENAREAGCKQLILLQCTSAYPARAEDTNLLTIPYLRSKYDCVVGLSDHTLGVEVALASVAVGAAVIEKHFTTSREEEGVDSAFSADEEEFETMVRSVNRVAAALGSVQFGYGKNEEKSLQFRRSIYVVKAIAKGEQFTEENVRIIRPGYGLHPRFYDRVLGKASDRNYDAGDRLLESVLKEKDD